MPTFIITIQDEEQIEHYKRRVQSEDINFVVQRLDQALNVKVRKPRRDKGLTRTEGATA